MCVLEGISGKKNKKQQQRLLRNMGAHSVVLELLQIPYEKVRVSFCNSIVLNVGSTPLFIPEHIVNQIATGSDLG